jgi:hypothetical protein
MLNIVCKGAGLELGEFYYALLGLLKQPDLHVMPAQTRQRHHIPRSFINRLVN